MNGPPANPIVHVEMHTGDLARTCAFYTRLFDWRAETVDVGAARSYTSLSTGNGLEGGVVECRTRRPLWLPYVEVPDLEAAMARARSLGARALLDPREGPVGWRGVISDPAGGEVALWQPKR